MTESKSKWMLFDDESSRLDRFGALLLATTLAAVMLSLVDLSGDVESTTWKAGTVAVTTLVSATLLLALGASGVSRRYRVVAGVLVGAGLLAALTVLVLEVIADEDTLVGPFALLPVVLVALSLIAPIFVIRRLTQHRVASIKTMLGAVSAYLLIALAFNFVFLAVDTYQGTPFFGTEQATTSFMYFSLVTITTLGYGDLAAVTDLGRLMATVEAVIGQVYLVTFVGMVVGLIVGQRRDRELAGSP